MADRIDLDEIMAALARGRMPSAAVVADMRNELCAWRASHHAGAVVTSTMRDSQPPLVVAAVEAYRTSVEKTMEMLGFPQVGDSAPNSTKEQRCAQGDDSPSQTA